MSQRRPLLRNLIRTFFADYLRLVEPDSARQMRLEQITFPRLEDETGLVAEIPSHHGETVTVLVKIELEALPPPETGQRLRRYLLGLELRYGQPLLLSLVYLQGGRPGIHLESGVISEACGIELVRIYYTTLSLAEARAEHFLERPEPLAWALATLMRPAKRTPEEHRCACLERIAAAPLDEERRRLLRQGAEALLVCPGLT